MPRSARLDAPGVLHHVIIRGIERRQIFADNLDKGNFLDRLGTLLPETRINCILFSPPSGSKIWDATLRGSNSGIILQHHTADSNMIAAEDGV